MSWIALSLLAPLFWTFSTFLDKYILGRYSKSVYEYVFFSSLFHWLNIIVLLFFVEMPEFSLESLIPLATGALLVYSFGFYAKALAENDTSTIVLLFKLGPVLTIILAYFFLNQTLSLIQVLGCLIVLAGASVISLEKGQRALFRGFGWISIAIIIWSIMTLLVDYGLTRMPFWDFFLLDVFGGALAGLSLLAIPHLRGRILTGLKETTAGKLVWYSSTNITDLLGQISIKGAFALAPSAGLVTVVSQTQSLYAIVFGYILTLFLPHIIKEDISTATLGKKLVGALIMLTGLYVLLG